MIIEQLVFVNLLQKIIIFLGVFFIFFITEFKNCESEHDHGLLWIKNAPMYGVHTNEEIEQFIYMYISCDVSLLLNPLQNAQQYQYTCTCKRKNHVCRLHYPLPPMHETKILKPFQINGNYPFSQQYLQTQVNKMFQSLKDLKENDDISFFEYLNSLNLDENTYILSLISI